MPFVKLHLGKLKVQLVRTLAPLVPARPANVKMSGTATSDIFDRIPLVEAKLNFELDRVKPGSFKDSEIALHRYRITSTGKLLFDWAVTDLFGVMK